MVDMKKEVIECPICMDPFDLDDHTFFPCPCDYQICRFCWHRIKNDENGLCPACRLPYSELPAQFKPLTKEQFSCMKIDKRNRASERKAKLADSRKHLAAVRVVQKCLVFVVGLSSRIADSDTLKRPEYFGKFGKIHKCVVNNNTNYAGSTGHSASAYITFCRTEDALRAIQQSNNIQVDGRTLKASLGTTKYCSQFLKALTCNKTDCMYLHELGDERASFTKEDMQQGKHQEYEQELHDEYFKRECESSQDLSDRYKTVFTLRSEANSNPVPVSKVEPENMTFSTTTSSTVVNGTSSRTTPSPSNAWGDSNRINGLMSSETISKPIPKEEPPHCNGFSVFSSNLESISCSLGTPNGDVKHPFSSDSFPSKSWDSAVFSGETYGDPARRLLTERSDSSTLSNNTGSTENGFQHLINLNILENKPPDDDLEFDPIEECQKGLEELMKDERLLNYDNLAESFPPSNNFGLCRQDPLSQSFNGFQSTMHHSYSASPSYPMDRQEWQAGLRALLPNVNIQFQSGNNMISNHTVPQNTWNNSSWINPAQYSMSSEDPAIISTRKCPPSNAPAGFWENNNYQNHNQPQNNTKQEQLTTEPTPPQNVDDESTQKKQKGPTKPNSNSSQLFPTWKSNGYDPSNSSAPPGFFNPDSE